MITEFVFSYLTWVANTIGEMLKASDRGKYKTKKRTSQDSRQQRPANNKKLATVAEISSSATADDEKE